MASRIEFGTGRPFVRPAHLFGEGRRNNYLNIGDVRGKALEAAACLAGQRVVLRTTLFLFLSLLFVIATKSNKKV